MEEEGRDGRSVLFFQQKKKVDIDGEKWKTKEFAPFPSFFSTEEEGRNRSAEEWFYATKQACPIKLYVKYMLEVS